MSDKAFEEWCGKGCSYNFSNGRDYQLAKEAFQAGVVQGMEKKFVISVQKMVESHRETWWVCIDHPDRAENAKPWDKGRTTPFMFEEKYKADQTADDFAEFFGDYAIRKGVNHE